MILLLQLNNHNPFFQSVVHLFLEKFNVYREQEKKISDFVEKEKMTKNNWKKGNN